MSPQNPRQKTTPLTLINIVTKELNNVWRSRIETCTLFSKTNNGGNEKKKNILDPDSDDAIDIANDLSLYQIILEKISADQNVWPYKALQLDSGTSCLR